MLRLLISLIIMVSFTQRAATSAPLPVNQLWEANLGPGRVTLGPTWAVDGTIHLLAGGGNRLKEFVNGRVVNQSPALEGTITAIDRADIDQADGVEILVAIKGDTLSELLMLNGLNFDVITQFELGRNPQTEILSIAGITAEAIMVVHSTYHFQSNDVIHYRETTRSARLYKVNTQAQQLGISISCGYGTIKRWSDAEHNPAGFAIFGTLSKSTRQAQFSLEHKTFMLTTLGSNGRATNAVDFWSGEWDEGGYAAYLGGTTIAPLPDGGFATFVAFTPSAIWPMTSSIYAHRTDDLEQIALNANLEEVPLSLAYLPPEASAEGRPFLLCAFERGAIRLFDLESFTFNQQEYVWNECWNMLQSGDFDEDGQTELFGLTGDVLTCSRIQQLSADPSPVYLTPGTFSLSAFPNPFNSSTTISYSLPRPGRYAIDVVDIHGRLVTRLADGWQEAGSYREVWDGSRLTSGQYMLKLVGTNSYLATPVTFIK